ncbi:hypothetical protein BGZ73_006827 [Actinomortierella ambigua]|nr:hypothetical protein BGZ73_006827 [Actinomortierella ambigua]
MENPVETTADTPKTTDPPQVTTTRDPPVTTTTQHDPTTTTTTTHGGGTTTTTDPPHTWTTTTRDSEPTRPRPRPTTSSKPYTTSYITTMTMTWTKVPRTTRDSNGRATTIYVPVTTYIPTVIPDPNQPPPPPPSDPPPDTASHSSGMTSWQIVLVALAVLLVLLAGMAAIFVARLKKKKDRLEQEQLKRDAFLEGSDSMVDIDALARGRWSGQGWKGDDGGAGGGGGGGSGGGISGAGGARPGSEMTSNTATTTGALPAIAGAMMPQHSMEHFRGSLGDEYGQTGATHLHRASMSNSSEGAGALMMLDEYSGGPYYYDYYGFPQDPAALQQQEHLSPSNTETHQRLSYPLPPLSMAGVPDPHLSGSHDQYADGYGHGHDPGIGTSAGTVARTSTTNSNIHNIVTSASSTPFLTSRVPPPPPIQQSTKPPPESGTFGTPVSLDHDPHSMSGHQTLVSNPPKTGGVSPSLLGQGSGTTPNTPTASAITSPNTSGNIVVGGGGITPGTTTVTTGATPPTTTTSARGAGRREGSGGTSSREISASDYLMYVPPTVNNPHTDYVPIQPTGVYAPSAPTSPQMMQMGRTHLQDPSSGIMRGIDVDPAHLVAHAKEENKRKDPHALIDHHQQQQQQQQSFFRSLNDGS